MSICDSSPIYQHYMFSITQEQSVIILYVVQWFTHSPNKQRIDSRSRHKSIGGCVSKEIHLKNMSNQICGATCCATRLLLPFLTYTGCG